VRRLRESGAIIVGKTNAPEIGQWPISDSKTFGIVRNPYNLNHTPGGSSGGSSSAVAAGLVSGAVGSDGGGSVRIPAAWTNLVGIKPGRGRISAHPVLDYGHGLSTNGPLARTVKDAATLYDALAGDLHPDERYQSEPLPEPLALAADRDPGRLRIAVCLNAPLAFVPNELDPAIKQAVLRIADVLADLGHDVERVKLQYGPIGATWVARGAAFCSDWAKANAPDISLLDPRTRAAVRAGNVARPALKAVVAAERPIARKVGRVFDRADVVLMPTTAQPPLRAGAIDGLGELATNAVISKACPYTFAWNVLGWPGVNVPAGFVQGDLPIGAQLLGRTGDEPQLISLAAQLEDRERWFQRRPDPASYGLAS
jgi:amidase